MHESRARGSSGGRGGRPRRARRPRPGGRTGSGRRGRRWEAGSAPDRQRRTAVDAGKGPSTDHRPTDRGGSAPGKAPTPQPEPATVTVPSVGIDAAVVELGLLPDRTLEVPSRFSDAGWYVDGPEPGEPGAAVIVGHVDSTTGPAAFFGLRDVRPGDRALVARDRADTLTFVVDAVEQHPKDRFPTEHVFRGGPTPTLRLVTCGGRSTVTVAPMTTTSSCSPPCGRRDAASTGARPPLHRGTAQEVTGSLAGPA